MKAIMTSSAVSVRRIFFALLGATLLLAFVSPPHASAEDPLTVDPLAEWGITVSVIQQIKGGGYDETFQATYVDNDPLSLNMTWSGSRDGKYRVSCGENTPVPEGGYDTKGSGEGIGIFSTTSDTSNEWQGLSAPTYTTLNPYAEGDYDLTTTVLGCDGSSNTGYGGSEEPVAAPVFIPGSEAELAAAPVGDRRTTTYSKVIGEAPGAITTTTVNVTAVKLTGMSVTVGYNWNEVFLKQAKSVSQSTVTARGSDFVTVTAPASLADRMRICVSDSWQVDLKKTPGTTEPVVFELPSQRENYDYSFSAASGTVHLTTDSSSNCVDGLSLNYGNFFRGTADTLPGGFKSDVKSLMHGIVANIYLDGQLWSSIAVPGDKDTAKYKKGVYNDTLSCSATRTLPYTGPVSCQ